MTQSVNEIDKLFERYKHEQKWGGEEDDNGDLQEGSVDLDDLKKEVNEIYRTALLAAKPKKKTYYKQESFQMKEHCNIYNSALDAYEERIKEIMK